MTDKLRDAAQAVLDRWDSLDWKAAPTADYMNRLRAALAAAPQPAEQIEVLRVGELPEDFFAELDAGLAATPGQRMIRAAEEAVAIARGEAEPASVYPAPQPAELCQFCHDAGASSCACLQPAPEQGMTRAEVGQMLDAKRHDREALVEVIRETGWSCLEGPEAIADALLARGLRLPGGETKPRRCAECDCEGGEYECTWIKPGPDKEDALQQLADLGQQADRASETMAWAVQLPDGSLAQEWGNVTLWGSSVDAKSYARGECPEGGKPVRVAIRVVEGGDDAA